LASDELGCLPVDRVGAELLFQVLGEGYEKGSTIITTNRIYKYWGKTFANDATLASAFIDRVIHHCETVIIKGKPDSVTGSRRSAATTCGDYTCGIPRPTAEGYACGFHKCIRRKSLPHLIHDPVTESGFSFRLRVTDNERTAYAQ